MQHLEPQSEPASITHDTAANPASTSTAEPLHVPSPAMCSSYPFAYCRITPFISTSSPIFLSGTVSLKAEQLCLSEESGTPQMLTVFFCALRKHYQHPLHSSHKESQQLHTLFTAQDDCMVKFILLTTWQFTLSYMHKQS